MNPHITRRELLKAGTSLVVTLGGAGTVGFQVLGGCTDTNCTPGAGVPDPEWLDTWLVIHQDNRVTAFFGKVDMAQGVDTAIAQIVAEELDVDLDSVSVVMGDTARTVNQGGLSASTACSAGGRPLRHAAAEARRVLLQRAGAHFGVSPSALAVENGMVFVRSAPDDRISYGRLITERGFTTALEWNNKTGNFLDVTGRARPKPPSDYRIVGQPVPRKDLPGKIFATTEYCHHVTLHGMLHGRMIRPPVANAVPVTVDQSSISVVEGARVVHEQNFLAVVAPTEWAAIKAARALEVRWSQTSPPFPAMSRLYEHIRQAPIVAANGINSFLGHQPFDPAPTERALAQSFKVFEAEYELPFQSHARMAPSVGLADVRDGKALILSDTQKPHYMRQGIAQLLGLREEDVQVSWRPGPGSYGRSDADEAAFEAAVLSRATGQPVRVQWMRDEGHAWDPKSPAAVVTVKAGLDEQGGVSAWYYRAKGFSGWDVRPNTANPGDTLAGMLLGHDKSDTHNFGVPEQSYAFPARVQFWETIAPLQEIASPLRCAHMRGPQEPQINFAQECSVDQVAVLVRQDPIAFRLRYLTDEREIHVLRAAVQASRWDPTVTGSRGRGNGVLRGCGVAVGAMFGTYVAVVCEVEVDGDNGRVWPRRLTIAHDCGLVINPRGLRETIEGNAIQGLSRALHEEVQFHENMVRSVDWQTYPILDVTDTPEAIDIVLVDRPEQPANGAGEATHVFIAAAVGNAVFDATGVHYRRLPLTPARIKAGLG